MKAWPTPGLFPVLAHQGGWDETLLVVGPLLVIGGALWLVNRRVTSRLEESDGADPSPGTAGATADPTAEGSADRTAEGPAGGEGARAERTGGPDGP